MLLYERNATEVKNEPPAQQQQPFEFDNPATPAVKTKLITPEVQKLHKLLSSEGASGQRVVPISVCFSYEEALTEMEKLLKATPADPRLLTDKKRITALMGKMGCPGHEVAK